jgi:hypothetical protein
VAGEFVCSVSFSCCHSLALFLGLLDLFFLIGQCCLNRCVAWMIFRGMITKRTVSLLSSLGMSLFSRCSTA